MGWGIFVFFALAIALIVYRKKFDKAVTPALEKVGEAGGKLHDALDEGVEVIGDKLEEARDVAVAKAEEIKAKATKSDK